MTPSARQEQQTAPPLDNAGTRPGLPSASTLLEFPTPGRAPKPQWRKELSERVREIQQRKAQEAARETEANAQRYEPKLEEPVPAEPPTPALGLVPPTPTPVVNPVVVAALKMVNSSGRARPGKPKPSAESRRMLSEITLSRQPENVPANVFAREKKYKMRG